MVDTLSLMVMKCLWSKIQQKVSLKTRRLMYLVTLRKCNILATLEAQHWTYENVLFFIKYSFFYCEMSAYLPRGIGRPVVLYLCQGLDRQ